MLAELCQGLWSVVFYKALQLAVGVFATHAALLPDRCRYTFAVACSSACGNACHCSGRDGIPRCCRLLLLHSSQHTVSQSRSELVWARACISNRSSRVTLDSVLVSQVYAAGPLQEQSHITVGVGHEGAMQKLCHVDLVKDV